MSSSSLFIRNMKHLEEKSQILNVVSILIIMDGKPIDRMRSWIFIANNSTIHPRWNQNRRSETSRSFRWNQAKFIVPIHILLFHFIKVFNTRQSEFLKVFFDFRGGKVWNGAFFGFTVGIGWDEVVRFAEDFFEAEWEFWVLGEGSNLRKCTCCSAFADD